MTTSLALAILSLLFGMLLFFKGSASWGSKSSSLSLLRVCLAFSFFIIMWDTANDLNIAAVQSGVSIGTQRTPKKMGRMLGGSSPARSVVKEKYALLQFIVGIVGFLYLLSRPDTWQFARRFVLAIRGVDARPDSETTASMPPPVEPLASEKEFEELLKSKSPPEEMM